MPCFKGIAVSVHAEGAPLPEYGLQKQSRVSRVNTYIPVPKPKVPEDGSSVKPEPAKFAISITLLTPSLPVPYSTPKGTPSDPYPQPQIVGKLPSTGSSRGEYSGSIAPYIPITKSDNETIAAYIYFDGRAKEEVATLLRPGEETWVNSRWVQVPESEGGGLAEREFLFREVGLERWLNGLDLEGHDAAAKIEKRRQKFDKRRSRAKEEHSSGQDPNIKDEASSRHDSEGILKYGANEMSPVETMSDEEYTSESDEDSPPEAAGQIKVAMFRVLASGEIKRGEYSPQFDAHDDDEEGSNKNGGDDEGADVDHTTSFAKPKTLDPKSISTQTVTGIDGPDKPFAVFTFFYRGERQLHKMGLIKDTKQQKSTATSNKRRSTQLDFSNLPPLKPGGTVGFSAFREKDPSSNSNKSRKTSNGSSGEAMLEDSDEDDDGEPAIKMEDVDDKDIKTLLSPEDARHTGELVDGVGRIKLKRQHSAEPLNPNNRKSPGSMDSTSVEGTPPSDAIDIKAKSNATLPPSVFGSLPTDDDFVGSPLKRQRASIHEADGDAMQKRLGLGFSSGLGDIVAAAEAARAKHTLKTNDADEEL